MKTPLDRAVALLQFADNEMGSQLNAVADDLKRDRIRAAQEKVREAIADIRARQRA